MLVYLLDHQGTPFTLRDIGLATGIDNPGSVRSRIADLRVQGWWIDRSGGRAPFHYTLKCFSQSLET